MLSLAPAIAPPLLPASRGGFSWWYVDLSAGPGSGAVLIWARRLPFVPSPPGADGTEGELSVVLAVYEGGKEVFYALQCGAQDRPLGRHRLAIGDSVFRCSSSGGTVELAAHLDMVVPSVGRVRGTLDVIGPRACPVQGGASHGQLDWSPVVLHGSGRAELSWPGGGASLGGSAYFDGNSATAPLGTLGIRDWRWGRVSFADRTVSYFSLTSSDPGRARATTLLESDASGATRTTHASAEFRDGALGWFGLRRGERARIAGGDTALDIVLADQVEDGPFYQRYLVEARDERGAIGRGIAERVAPERLDASWHRPLVNMRIERVGKPTSTFLPLFCGPSRSRVRRLFASWMGRGQPAMEAAP